MDDYLQATEHLPIGGRFQDIADSVISERDAETDLMKARALYDYIIDNMRYAKQGVYGTGDANYACDVKSGNCTEFHSLFISLARSAQLPARFAVGAAIPSERNEGGVDGYHCWAEFYAEDKWWPVDISEANKYTPLATYYFGHHPANRIELSRGRNIVPDPMPESGPINFFVYPVLEIDGKASQVKTTFSFRRVPKLEI
jgi:transglutaminase-like putative cysteine protease